mmetsp:Transcript_30176/g.79257  ORF Transcript_30176/g.79257 Transcript_30176/m.79257 type:complete len:168 (+) Transcript_30176:213-716(+)
MDWLDDADELPDAEWRRVQADREWSRLRTDHGTAGFREAAAASEEAARAAAVHTGFAAGFADGLKRGELLGRVRGYLAVLQQQQRGGAVLLRLNAELTADLTAIEAAIEGRAPEPAGGECCGAAAPAEGCCGGGGAGCTQEEASKPPVDLAALEAQLNTLLGGPVGR